MSNITSQNIKSWFDLVTATQTPFQSFVFLFKIIGPAIILLIYTFMKKHELEEKKFLMELAERNRNEDNVNRRAPKSDSIDL